MRPIDIAELDRAWWAGGIERGTHLMVHSSLSSLGQVEGGADAVVDSLLRALGRDGTLVVPTFTPSIADPCPSALPPLSAEQVVARRVAPSFDPELPSEMGAISEVVRRHPLAVRSQHPQVSVAAIGRLASAITAGHPMNFAVGAESPFARLCEVDGQLLLIGVGHDRNALLHHAESLARWRRLKVRRYPLDLEGGRVWEETLDVDDDLGRLFPDIGEAYEQQRGIERFMSGEASCLLVCASDLVEFARVRFNELLRYGDMDAVDMDECKQRLGAGTSSTALWSRSAAGLTASGPGPTRVVTVEDRGPDFDGVRIGRPATGALIDAGYRTLADLPADLSELLHLHGVGPSAVRRLTQARPA